MSQIMDDPDAKRIYVEVWTSGAHCSSELSLILDIDLPRCDFLIEEMVKEGILERTDEDLGRNLSGVEYRPEQKPVQVAKTAPKELMKLLVA